MVFVPLLAFDWKGNRIGYEKGYYDRFLAGCKSEVVKVGLSFFKAHDEFLPKETTDVGLDYVVTPEKIYYFWQKIFLLKNNKIPTPIEMALSATLNTYSKKV